MKKKDFQNVALMPVSAQKTFKMLLKDLRDKGPVQPAYRNYSRLGRNEYHCHLAYRWVACWRNDKGSLLIEVYYAGSRENAPY